jgi:heme/copper-type cytochrome/quinol oxidase subunit 4
MPSLQSSRQLQAVAILVLAVVQIVSAQLTDFLHIGQSVALRSQAALHPLVPAGYAFAIWAAIYLWSLISAVWQMGEKHRDDPALKAVGWNMAGVYLINSLWQIWVPLRGLEWISFVLVALALVLGLSGLLRLRELGAVSGEDTGFVFAPMALTSGWLTAATFINFTSVLVGQHYALNPVNPGVSMVFLGVLLAFGALMAWLTTSLTYSLGLMWAAFWIMMANIYRDHDLGMATLSLAGIIVIAVVCAWALYERRPSQGGHHHLHV